MLFLLHVFYLLLIWIVSLFTSFTAVKYLSEALLLIVNQPNASGGPIINFFASTSSLRACLRIAPCWKSMWHSRTDPRTVWENNRLKVLKNSYMQYPIIRNGDQRPPVEFLKISNFRKSSFLILSCLTSDRFLAVS